MSVDKRLDALEQQLETEGPVATVNLRVQYIETVLEGDDRREVPMEQGEFPTDYQTNSAPGAAIRVWEPKIRKSRVKEQ